MCAMELDAVAVHGRCQPESADIILTKAAVDTDDGRLDFHRTDVKGHM